jgi:hypothetical protein
MRDARPDLGGRIRGSGRVRSKDATLAIFATAMPKCFVGLLFDLC